MIVDIDLQCPYYRLLTYMVFVTLAFKVQSPQEVLRYLQSLWLHALKMPYHPGEMLRMPWAVIGQCKLW